MKKVIRFDASALSKSACELAFYRTVVEGYKELTLFNDTLYGTAFHKFLYSMAVSNGNFQQAVVAAQEVIRRPCQIRKKKEHLTENHLLKTCFDYWEQVASKESGVDIVTVDDKPIVEVKFDIPIIEVEEYSINLAGTIDRFTKIRNGCYCIRDYKTTSSWDADKFLKPYRLKPQLKVYVWAIKEMARRNPDGVFGKLANQVIGAAIDGIFLKSKQETIFQSSEVYQFKPDEMQMFDYLIQVKAYQIESMLSRKNGNPDGMIEDLCGGIFLCKFFDVCAAPDDIAAQHILRNTFKQTEYNPLTFGEEES